MRWLRRWGRGSRVAAAFLAASAVVAAVAVGGAVRVEAPDPGGTPDPSWNPIPPDTRADHSTPDSLLTLAVSADPFREDRSPPDVRYVLPANRPDPAASRRADARDGLRLEGTAVLPGRPGLAAFRLPGGKSRVTRAGADVQGLRVVRVEEGRVVLRGPDTTLVLRVESSGERGPSP